MSTATIEQPATTDATSVSTIYTFYAPTAPEEGIKVAGRADPVRFHRGVLTTDDPGLAETIRRANRGAYFEADLDAPLVCDRCGAQIRNQRAFQRHVELHAGT